MTQIVDVIARVVLISGREVLSPQFIQIFDFGFCRPRNSEQIGQFFVIKSLGLQSNFGFSNREDSLDCKEEEMHEECFAIGQIDEDINELIFSGTDE